MDRIEWLKWRRGGIGASDSPAIMGVSPWQTRRMLYHEKRSTTEPVDENSFIKQLGNEMEPRIRALYEMMEGKSFSPALVVMEDADYIRASLDGRSEDTSEIVEIKLSGKADWELAESGKVPEKYWPQVQHQLGVTGAEVCHFLSYRYSETNNQVIPDFLAVVEVKPDHQYIDHLFMNIDRFWKHNVLAGVEPAPMLLDYCEIKGFKKEAQSYHRLKQARAELDRQIMTIEDFFLEELDHIQNNGLARFDGVLCERNPNNREWIIK